MKKRIIKEIRNMLERFVDYRIDLDRVTWMYTESMKEKDRLLKTHTVLQVENSKLKYKIEDLEKKLEGAITSEPIVGPSQPYPQLEDSA